MHILRSNPGFFFYAVCLLASERVSCLRVSRFPRGDGRKGVGGARWPDVLQWLNCCVAGQLPCVGWRRCVAGWGGGEIAIKEIAAEKETALQQWDGRALGRGRGRRNRRGRVAPRRVECRWQWAATRSAVADGDARRQRGEDAVRGLPRSRLAGWKILINYYYDIFIK